MQSIFPEIEVNNQKTSKNPSESSKNNNKTYTSKILNISHAQARFRASVIQVKNFAIARPVFFFILSRSVSVAAFFSHYVTIPQFTILWTTHSVGLTLFAG